jgi:hypothetical protein
MYVEIYVPYRLCGIYVPRFVLILVIVVWVQRPFLGRGGRRYTFIIALILFIRVQRR